MWPLPRTRSATASYSPACGRLQPQSIGSAHGATDSALGDDARAVQPAADLHAAARADQGQAHLMTVFESAVDATFAAFAIDAVYTPAGGGEPAPYGLSPGVRTRSLASARPASTPRPRPSSYGRARSQARARATAHGWRRDDRRPGRAGAARPGPARVDFGRQAGVSGSARLGEPLSPLQNKPGDGDHDADRE